MSIASSEMIPALLALLLKIKFFFSGSVKLGRVHFVVLYVSSSSLWVLYAAAQLYML